MYTLRPSTHADVGQVNALRCLAYMSSGSFNLKDPAALDMRTDPEKSMVLGMWADDARLAGCVRVTFCPSYAAAVAVLEVLPPIGEQDLPLVAMCRAATHPDFRGRGILPLICTAAVEWARAQGARSVAAVMVDGAPHKRVMTEMGWSMQRIVENDMSLLRPNADFLFLHLAQRGFQAAIDRGRSKSAGTWAQVSVLLH